MKRILKGLRNSLILLIGLIMLAAAGLYVLRGINRERIRKAFAISVETGIDQEEIVTIGGIRQFLYIRGENKNNPLVLILHGGPGSPIMPLLHLFQNHLEDNYTVVNWDQRNSGKTYFLNDPEDVYNTLSMGRMVEDVKEVVLYLQEHYGSEIILLGHSWGSVLGTVFAQTYPELITAYIGVGQVINASEGNELALEEAIKAAETKNPEEALFMKEIDHYQLSDPKFEMNDFLTARKLIGKYLSPNISEDYLQSILVSPYYSLQEVSYFLKDTMMIQKPLLDYLGKEYDARDLNNFDVPVYYIQGELDWVTPTVMVEEYFESILASKKQLIVISDAGHSPMFDQPEAFSEAVKTVLAN